MTVLSQPQSVGIAANGRVPPLENGDRLTRPEFERRYAAMPHVKKAELIEGVVYMPSPVSNEHAEPHFDLITWLGFYRAATPGVSGGDNGTLRLDLDNEPQPDAFLRILAEHGGQARVDEDGYVNGAPELAAEVARSSVSIDLHAKLHAYRRNGVREYIVWRVEDRIIDWFVLREGRYEPLAPAADGLYRSEVLPGLWLDAAALLRSDLLAVFQTVQRGLDSPEHAAFVRRLQEAAAQGQS
ncbi:MAG TPA: Uma2 family endonuclease [Gemmataceae bacterium]|nr:Uma2 family endonuclease [Gemmataceae bacterium]